MFKVRLLDAAQMWGEFHEAIVNYDDTSRRLGILLEQMHATEDASDYLWYTFRFQQEASDAGAVLNVKSLGHVLRAFVNGQASGCVQGSKKNPEFNLQSNVSLNAGVNNVPLLSVMVGLPVISKSHASPNFTFQKLFIQLWFKGFGSTFGESGGRNKDGDDSR
ncbi:hypothetical protein MANES_18G106950v8 [Manihot esculenta]|uniref:Uncharacterized protein n=1 Tax=Manihot esculenta TaxID=3983 RepID=A0ACB7G0R8_MANES|nr:hypothetical protein MANES_18G106950v8 [Manihot esculenta]